MEFIRGVFEKLSGSQLARRHRLSLPLYGKCFHEID